MQIVLGWLMVVFGGGLYLAQLVSSINFSFAQRIGIQEKADTADNLLQRSERYTAYWDLITLAWFPAGGVLMILDHHWWPVISLAGSVVYFDAAGREFAKNLSFRHEGIKTGTDNEKRLFFTSYIVMMLMAVVVMAYSISSLCI